MLGFHSHSKVFHLLEARQRLLLALVEVKEGNCKSNHITRFFVLCSRNFGRNECIASRLLPIVYIRHEIVKFLHLNTHHFD